MEGKNLTCVQKLTSDLQEQENWHSQGLGANYGKIKKL